MLIKTDDKVNLYYQTAGDSRNPAIIFANSLGTQLSMWQPQIDALSKHYYVINYDTRGHGQSDKPQGPYSLTRLGQDVLCVLGALGIKNANFCGISMGGLTGLWLAIYAPERFERIAVANTAAKIGERSAWLERAAMVRAQGMGGLAQSAASRWFTPAFIEQNPELINTMVSALAAEDAEGYASCCEALAEADLRDEIARINMPLLVIAGDDDPVTTVADAKAIQAAVSTAKVKSLAASHISNLEQPAAFNRTLKSFFAGK